MSIVAVPFFLPSNFKVFPDVSATKSGVILASGTIQLSVESDV